MNAILKVFVAGSKELSEERKVCRSVCNVLQNQWGAIETKTFEDFSETISEDSHQNEYNAFICNEADVVIFLFSEQVGDITLSEFNKAYASFKRTGHPRILVYFDKACSDYSHKIDNLKAELSSMGQYYKEYSNLDELERKVEKHLNKILITKTKPNRDNNNWNAFWGFMLLLGGWLFLSLLGGIGMYIYDRNMSEDKCIDLAVEYLEYGKKGEMLYYFPDKLYVYDIRSANLDILERTHTSLPVDITLPKVEHATFGMTVTLLMSRILKFKPHGNGKQLLGYVAAVTAGVVGVGVGCVIEQMIFPPQYSKPMRDLLDNPSNWEKINSKRNPSNWF